MTPPEAELRSNRGAQQQQYWNHVSHCEVSISGQHSIAVSTYWLPKWRIIAG
uniref:Uncharacterized protein n=1 Tax=Anguilla anguilla TaxID=7936 RepID=A0A0E9UQ50_ANGAN